MALKLAILCSFAFCLPAKAALPTDQEMAEAAAIAISSSATFSEFITTAGFAPGFQKEVQTYAESKKLLSTKMPDVQVSDNEIWISQPFQNEAVKLKIVMKPVPQLKIEGRVVSLKPRPFATVADEIMKALIDKKATASNDYMRLIENRAEAFAPAAFVAALAVGGFGVDQTGACLQGKESDHASIANCKFRSNISMLKEWKSRNSFTDFTCANNQVSMIDTPVRRLAFESNAAGEITSVRRDFFEPRVSCKSRVVDGRLMTYEGAACPTKSKVGVKLQALENIPVGRISQCCKDAPACPTEVLGSATDATGSKSLKK